MLGCVLALVMGELGGSEVPLPGLFGGPVVALDESAGRDGLDGADGGELTGGLDVFGAVLDDDTAFAMGRQEGPAAG